jgi:hypothetical protein
MGRFLLLAAIAVVLAGCGGREATAPGELRYTRIDWLGNECFRITSPIGTSILTNPYASKTEGRSLPANLKSDVVLITSESPRRNNVNAFSNQPAILRGGVGIGINNVTGIGVLGVPVYRDPELASSLGMNLVYAWTMDGIRYCFIESPVRPLDTYQLGQIGRVDVLLMTPAGVGASVVDSCWKRISRLGGGQQIYHEGDHIHACPTDAPRRNGNPAFLTDGYENSDHWIRWARACARMEVEQVPAR